MNLVLGEKGLAYRVTAVRLEEDITRRLRILGMTDGVCVELVNRSLSGALIIRLRGTRYAMGREYAAGIVVEENGGTVKWNVYQAWRSPGIQTAGRHPSLTL